MGENVLPATDDTLITITGFGDFKYQARSATQTLEIIGGATQLERTINGELIDLSAPQFRKYITKIGVSAEINPTPMDGMWPGMEVVVQCAVQLAKVTTSPDTLGRNAVSGSIWYANGYTFYRPELTMLIKTLETHFDEWKNVVGWSIELEEK
jgi:hypothetical protein